MRAAFLVLALGASPLLLAGDAGRRPTPAPDGYTSVPSEVLDAVHTLLPEMNNSGAAYVSDSYDANLLITEDATVDIVFVSEGAGYRNAIGYFTYEENADGSVTVLDRQILWPNLSFPPQGSLQTGDTLTLKDENGVIRTFHAGERIGFWLVADGWGTEPEIWNFDPSTSTIPSSDPSTNALLGRGCYTTVDKINPEHDSGYPELARHVALIRHDGIAGFLNGEDFLITAFEDLNRTSGSDDDFNDAVFIAVPTPVDAYDAGDVFHYTPGDPDGDGVSGTDDQYPDDPERAFVTRYPTHGSTVIGFEDLYPDRGDADYNDAVVAYAFTLVTNAGGDVKDILADFHLVARGAGLDHALGLHIPGLPDNATGTIWLERFLSDGTHQVEDPRTVEAMIQDYKRIPDIFPSTKTALPAAGNRTYANTQEETPDRPAASARLRITLDTPVDPNDLGTVPYDIFFYVKRDNELWDVHFPGWSGFPDRPSHLPEESGSDSFMDPDDYPFLLEIPEDWQYPLEKVRIEQAYSRFRRWRTSGGSRNTDWYEHPSRRSGRVSSPLADYIPTRSWQRRLPDR